MEKQELYKIRDQRGECFYLLAETYGEIAKKLSSVKIKIEDCNIIERITCATPDPASSFYKAIIIYPKFIH